jgi:hypothetical protein
VAVTNLTFFPFAAPAGKNDHQSPTMPVHPHQSAFCDHVRVAKRSIESPLNSEALPVSQPTDGQKNGRTSPPRVALKT